MIKVKGLEFSANDSATIVFKKAAPSVENKYHGRYLDPSEEAPLSFLEKKHKDLSEMYQRMLIGLGVSQRMCKSYVIRSRSTEGLMHTHMMGTADPTGCIPYRKVFISGRELQIIILALIKRVHSQHNNVACLDGKNAKKKRDTFGACLSQEKVLVGRR